MFAQLKWRVTTLCLLLMAATPMAEAQQVASSFEQLRVLVKPGDTVTVAETSGRETTGKIADLSSSSLWLIVAGSRRDLAEREVDTIRQRRHGSLATGAKWGFGIGAGFGLIGGLASGTNCIACSGAFIALATAGYAAMGTGIGVGIS